MQIVELDELYDSAFQMINMQVGSEFDYSKTVEFEDGVLVDFDDRDVPCAIELHAPAKRFSLKWNALIGAKFDALLNITDDVISLRIDVKVNFRLIEPRFIEFEVPNTYGISPGEFKFLITEIPI